MAQTDIAQALSDLLLDQSLPLAEAVNRHFHENYRQRTNGVWDDRESFVAHISHLRDVIESGTIDVLDAVVNGRQYSDRHVVHLTKRDGTTVSQEVYLFGDLAQDGRFLRAEEVTMMLTGTEEDRALGNAR
jgi:hypothetical protein